jgi:hypothetical protein
MLSMLGLFKKIRDKLLTTSVQSKILAIVDKYLPPPPVIMRMNLI